MSRKKQKKPTAFIIGFVAFFLILFAVLASIYFTEQTFIGDEFANTGNIYCAEYEYKCCSVDKGNPELVRFNDVYFGRCYSNSYECDVVNVETGYQHWYKVCDSCKISSILGIKYADCDGCTGALESWEIDQRKIRAGQYVVPNHAEFGYTIRNYNFRLFDCGSSPCAFETSGVPIDSGGCSFSQANSFNVYDEQQRVQLENYQGAVTVPQGRCYLTSGFANRRVCGNVGDICTSAAECVNMYPYKYTLSGVTYGATCSQNKLTLYGCVKATESQCINKDIFPDGEEQCLQYNTFSYCGVAAGKEKTVECCPDQTNACAANAVCDPKTFTCETTRECDADYQCESAGESCDWSTKVIKVWGCNTATGKCGVKKEIPVECCYDANCPQGYECSSNKCRQMITPKPACDKVCCTNDGVHIDKPCATGLVCCPDGSECVSDLAECEGGGGGGTDGEICFNDKDDDKDNKIDELDCTCEPWIKAPELIGGATILPNLGCEFKKWILPKIYWMAGILGVIAMLMVYVAAESYISQNKIKTKNWAVPKWVILLILSTLAGVLVALVTIWFWWVGLLTLLSYFVITIVLKKFSVKGLVGLK